MTQVQAAAKYLKDQNMVNKDVLEEKRYFCLSLEGLLEDASLKQSWPDITEMLDERCELVCGVFGLAMHHTIQLTLDTGDTFPLVRARLNSSQLPIQLKELKSCYFQRLVCVEGEFVIYCLVRITICISLIC